MKITVKVNDVPVAAFALNPGDKLDITAITAAAGETLGQVNVDVAGGALSVNRSALKTTGPISFHMFGGHTGVNDPDRYGRMLFNCQSSRWPGKMPAWEDAPEDIKQCYREDAAEVIAAYVADQGTNKALS